MRPTKLTEDKIAEELSKVADWKRQGDEITRQFKFADFNAAVSFVNSIAAEAERLNHHPDIDIRYDKVRLVLSTHDAGGLTSLDFELAKLADQFAE